MTILYGIPNCDTVKKARAWLNENNIAYDFVDFKKTPPEQTLIEHWLQTISPQVLLNKRGTTWRTLSSQQQAEADNHSGAIQLLLAYPSLIKRPVLNHNNHFYIGFSAAQYEQIFF